MAARTPTPAKRAPQRRDPHRAAVIARLNTHVALAADLYSQLKQAHWNVVGHGFIAVHELFDAQGVIALAHVDLFAERIRSLQGVPAGTVRQAAKASKLPELEVRELSVPEAIAEILKRFELYGASLKDAAKASGDEHDDSATEDIFVEALRAADQQAYFLRSHLAA